jgi:hypothetical protein
VDLAEELWREAADDRVGKGLVAVVGQAGEQAVAPDGVGRVVGLKGGCDSAAEAGRQLAVPSPEPLRSRALEIEPREVLLAEGAARGEKVQLAVIGA